MESLQLCGGLSHLPVVNRRNWHRAKVGCPGVIGPFPQPVWIRVRIKLCLGYRFGTGLVNTWASKRQAKTHLSKILDQVRDGEEVIFAKGGRPYAKLVPVSQGQKRHLGFVSGMMTR